MVADLIRQVTAYTLAGVTKRTWRNWEESGVVKPYWITSDGLKLYRRSQIGKIVRPSRGNPDW